MKRVKKLVSLISAAVIICTVSFAYALQEDRSAAEVILEIRKNIDSHMSGIQTINSRLIGMSAEDVEAADFSAYDTSKNIMGVSLYKFNDGIPAVLRHFASGNAEDKVSGNGGEIVTFNGGRYNVHSIIGLGGYPDLFADNTVLRAATGGRVKLVKAYPEGIPDYQVVKNRSNIYVENIDFTGFSMIKFEFCKNIIFNNCKFDSFSENGLVFRGCRDVAVLNCEFKNCGNKMKDYTNGGYSIRFIGTEEHPAENILVENCVIDNPCGNAVSLLDLADNFAIRNNKITNSVWSAIHYWTPKTSGNYTNVIENNECVNIGFGIPSPNDESVKSGMGCSAIYASRGTPLRNTVVKNNTVSNAVENGIEGAYELVYHNKIMHTGENSAVRYTKSTEGIYILPNKEIEQKYVSNTIETRGVRCISMYSDEDVEYKAVYITGNSFNLEETDPSVVCAYKRADIEINCKRLKKLVIRNNKGMLTDKPSVNIYIDKSYVMDYFDLENRCMIGTVPASAKYCYNINNR